MRRWIFRILLGSLLLVGAYVAYEYFTWPDVASLARTNPKTTAFIEAYRDEQRAAGRDPSVQWAPVPYARISPWLKRAVICSEDMDFFGHKGVDVRELRAALEDAWEDRSIPRGASTLSQQLAKNLWLSPSRNPVRKVKELLLTRQLEREVGKRRILELYLNVVEFGPGVYGAEAAARRYFGTGAASLDAHQAASLAAALPRPKSWHPGVSSRAYARRVATIERRMDRARWVAGLI